MIRCWRSWENKEGCHEKGFHYFSRIFGRVSGFSDGCVCCEEETRSGKVKTCRNKDGVVDEKERRMEMKKIDLNGDGKIDAKEKRISWLHSRSKVNTAMELKYDTNSDGWIEADEAREMLRHRYRLIKTNGQVKVDSAIEREYDMNGDGVIDRLEAEALKDDLE